jgi:hypothetical protein
MGIESAVERGHIVYVYDEEGRPRITYGLTTSRQDRLMRTGFMFPSEWTHEYEHCLLSGATQTSPGNAV